jgi:hypothetical protein
MSIENENIHAPSNPMGEEIRRGEHVRVRKRIRVKRKKSPKKKIRKFFERILWTVVILAFLMTLFYLLKQLDLTDQRYKKKALLNKSKDQIEVAALNTFSVSVSGNTGIIV